MWARIILLAASFLMTFLVVEIGLRLSTNVPNDGCQPVVLGRVRLLPNALDPQAAEALLDKEPQLDADAYVIPDKLLGWTVGPSGKTGLYTSNPQGLRSTSNATYATARPKNAYRIVTVGDSFTHGDDVANDQTWQHYLEQQDSRYQVLNLGVGGYGTDQAFLRWRKRRDDFQAHAVILGIWPENICRNLNVDRFFLTGCSQLKPRFYLNQNNELTLLDAVGASKAEKLVAYQNPDASELMKYEGWRLPSTQGWRPWYASRVLQTILSVKGMIDLKAARLDIYSDANPTGNDMTVAIAKRFSEEVRQTGAEPVILILPMDVLIEDYSAEGSLPLIPKLRAAGIEVIDATPKMLAAAKARGVDIFELVRRRGHYSPAGNEVIAEILHEYFKKRLATASDS